MHDNPRATAPSATQSDPAADFALPDHHVVSLTGRDAAAFAQAQFMNDVDSVAVGEWQWNGWLTPKGRVVALFALLRIDDATVWLLLPDADPASIAAALQRFIFRSKVVVAVRDDLRVTAAFAPPLQARGARLGAGGGGVVELDLGAEGGPRRLWIGVGAAVEDHERLARWMAFDLAHGLPRLPAAQVEQWTPQQLSLERLHAFSVKKGCYPGQEIVARTHFLGKAKRGLALLEADLPLAVGMEVGDGGTLLGTVIACSAQAGRHLGLAVVPNERVAAVASAGGITAHELPIGSGLAR